MDSNNFEEKKKEKEIAATNRLLNVIRGERNQTDGNANVLNNHLRDDKQHHELSSPSNQGDESLSSLSEDQNQTSASLSHEPLFTSMQYPTSQTKKSQFSWLKNKEKRAIGLDIGSHSIKYVLIAKEMSGLKVIDYKIVELPYDHTENEATMYTKILKSVFNGINLDNITLVTSLSGPSVIVRHVQFPPMNEKELAQSLNWEAKSYVPFPLNEVNLDYQILPRKNKNQRLDVILVAVTKKMLRSHLDILEKASIKPDVIDIAPLVMINTYMLNNEDIQDRTIALINIGAQSSILSIYRQGSLFFTRDIHIGGNAITKQIQSQWNISYEQAESIKKRNLHEENPSINGQELQKIYKPVLNDLISEIRRSLIYYDNQTGKKGFGMIIITGGGALLPGIQEAFDSELGLTARYLEPFKKLNINEITYSSLKLKGQTEKLSLSVGLALRGVL